MNALSRELSGAWPTPSETGPRRRDRAMILDRAGRA